MTGEKKTRESTGFLLKQRAFLKLYLITLMEQKRAYGLQILETLHETFRIYGYKPTHSAMYEALYDLVEDGILHRQEIVPEHDRYKKLVFYEFTADGESRAELYKKQLKAELDRCQGIIQQAIRDNFG
jgi:DNA-binding PadR family transcriptional regulator